MGSRGWCRLYCKMKHTNTHTKWAHVNETQRTERSPPNQKSLGNNSVFVKRSWTNDTWFILTMSRIIRLKRMQMKRIASYRVCVCVCLYAGNGIFLWHSRCKTNSLAISTSTLIIWSLFVGRSFFSPSLYASFYMDLAISLKFIGITHNALGKIVHIWINSKTVNEKAEKKKQTREMSVYTKEKVSKLHMYSMCYGSSNGHSIRDVLPYRLRAIDTATMQNNNKLLNAIYNRYAFFQYNLLYCQ